MVSISGVLTNLCWGQIKNVNIFFNLITVTIYTTVQQLWFHSTFPHENLSNTCQQWRQKFNKKIKGNRHIFRSPLPPKKKNDNDNNHVSLQSSRFLKCSVFIKITKEGWSLTRFVFVSEN